MIPPEVFAETLLEFFAPIRPYLEDPSVSEVMINGPDEIYIERKGRISKTDARFSSQHALSSALQNLAQYVGKTLDHAHPILEGRLPDGSRVEAIIPPAAPLGPNVAIRRFVKESMTVDRLIELGALDEDSVHALRALVGCKQNIIVAGGTGSGKTSLLNVLSSFSSEGERVVVIEDSRELQLQLPHVVHLEARPPDERGRGAVSIRDLFRATLRMRPDRIVVGEIRGGEALELIQAMTSGHGGCMSTIHASYPSEAFSRLETMALMSDVDLPLFALRAQIASAVNVIVQTSRLPDGSRAITHISEALGYDESGGFKLADLFIRRYDGRDSRGRVISSLVPTGTLPRSLEMLQTYGFDLPASMYEAAASPAAREGAARSNPERQRPRGGSRT